MKRFLFLLCLLSVMTLQVADRCISDAPLLLTQRDNHQEQHIYDTFSQCEVKETENKVAVIHTTTLNSRHHDEFDPPLKELGWTFDKYNSTTESMQQLVQNLEQYDMVLAAPLFNHESNDLSPFASAFRDFVEKGGALIITDALYLGPVKWLTAIEPSLIVGHESCQAAHDPFGTEQPHTLRFLPNILRDGNSWGHLTVPEKHGWELVTFCGEGNPATVMKRLGRGFIYVTAFRQPNTEALENLRAALELQKVNIHVTNFQMPELAVGAGTLSLSLRNTGSDDADVQVQLVLTPEKNTKNPLFFVEKIKLTKDGKESNITIPYNNNLRGMLSAQLTLEKGNDKAGIFNRNIELPNLLTVLPPRYRGFALDSELQRTETILPGISVAPYDEEIATMWVKIYVTDTDGKTLGTPAEHKIEQRHFRFPVHVGSLSAGTYHLCAELFIDEKMLEKRSTDLTVLDASRCNVFIDDDINLLIDGVPFFPIGLYHINPEDLETYGAELGINFIQLWSWDPSGLDIAQRLGIKVLWEQNHRNPEVIAENVPRLIDNDSIVMWYGLDEPYEADFARGLAVHEAFHRVDTGRPTFMVTYVPRLFEQHAQLADIMAVDPYPYPNRPITVLSDQIDAAWKATKGDQPVYAVLQSFGADADPVMRAMAYLALTHEARGILWYPWDDGKPENLPGIGLKYHLTTREIVKELVAEVRTLSPALLNKSSRRQFKSVDEKIHGLFCEEKEGKKYVLLVNPHDERNTIELDKLAELKGVVSLADISGTKTFPLNRPLVMQPYEAIAYIYQSFRVKPIDVQD